MGGNTCARRKFHYLSAAAPALALVAPLTALAAPAARVEFAMGDPVAVSPSGQSRSLVKGVQVESGETVYTKSGRMQLRFTDGAYVSLQPNSEFRIDEYRYDGKTDGSERGFFSLLKGGMRTITGLVGRTNKKNYQVSTTVATIGIRGTEYTIAYTNSITGSVGEGEVEVCSGLGCVPFGSGQSFVVHEANSRPQLTSQKTDLPPQQPQDGVQPQLVIGDQTTSDGTNKTLCEASAAECSPAPAIPILTGTQTGMVAAKMGFGPYALGNVTVIFDSKGAATEIDGVAIATDAADFGNDGVIAWGRGLSNEDGSIMTHYVTALRTPDADLSSLIAGRVVATYTMIGGSSPTGHGFDAVTPAFFGTLNSASMTVDFGAQKVNADFKVTMSGLSFVGKAMGMPMNGALFGIDPQNTMASCNSGGGPSCTLSRMEGFVAGAGASRGGFAYEVLTPDLIAPGCTSACFTTIKGAAALSRKN
jgi:FecR protein